MLISNVIANRPPSYKLYPQDMGSNSDRDLAERGHKNAQHEQEHTASRDYDKQRRGGKPEKEDPKPVVKRPKKS